MDRRDEGWSLAAGAPGERGGKVEARLLDALRHGRSRTVRRVRLDASTRVLWEIDAGEPLDAFVRATIERAAKRLRAEERCLAPADQRVLRAFEERDADARDLAEAARDEAARRVFDALRAIEERKFAARRNRPDLEDAVRDAQQESARAHAAAAFDDALAHALDPRAHHGKVLEDVARAFAWIATAEQGGMSLDWDRELDRVRGELETLLEARLLAIAPAVRPEPESKPAAQPASKPNAVVVVRPAPTGSPFATLSAAIARRFPLARVRLRSADRHTADVVFPGRFGLGYGLQSGLATIGAAHGWRLFASVDDEHEMWSPAPAPRPNEQAITLKAHPLASAAFTTAAIADARAALSLDRRMWRQVSRVWFAAGRLWLRCSSCEIALAPLECDFHRARCPRCADGQLVLIDVPPSPVRWAERAHLEPEPMPKGSRWPADPIEQLVICSACFATASVETDDLALEMCRTCGCIGTLELT